ncbi:hypothetical protein GCM10007079_01250 [Nocardiopsis terrae]|uniref:DUF4190 domain-containing protein n=1 Tax=Nocardiopsis terrae TaxID=372655 RepID=A0ABR9HMC0_9ACTN|nr:hypothetical protein [Nocardiopsis terrae]MBE1460177.1 hypothetical protein [Nocardiopsis terrae]GHC70085.1 hypothetical protein GCM10007079_01250 [Nocardiopsis terrae]
MTDNGGDAPGNRSSEQDADSWFKPSENRYRTQSEYQDPLEGEEGTGEGGDAPAGGAVFPDSGGYAGLSASRPAMVEPYPDALGGPSETPQETPPTYGGESPYVPGISYPGAGSAAYQPVTRIPGESDPLGAPGGFPEPEGPSRTGSSAETGGPVETRESSVTGGYPGIAASAEVPLPPEGSEPAPEPAHDSWAAGGNDSWAARPAEEEPEEAPADEEPGAEPPRAADTDAPAAQPWAAEAPGTVNGTWSAEAPRAAGDDRAAAEPAAAARPWGAEPSVPEPAQDGWTAPVEDSWAPQTAAEPEPAPAVEPSAPEPVQDTWAGAAGETWRPEPDRDQPQQWQGTGGLDSWSPVPDSGDVWRGAGTTEPWAEPTTRQWSDPAPAPSYGVDRYDDELSPRPVPPLDEFPAHDQYTRDRTGGYEDELSAPSPEAASAEQDGIGSGSGNTWAFDRDDPRLPDVVRDAERRRRDTAPEEPSFTDWGADTDWTAVPAGEPAGERDGGPDTGELSAAVATSEDPLAAIADMQSRARAKEDPGAEEEYGPDPGQGWDERPGQGWDERPWDAPARDELSWDAPPAEEPSWGRPVPDEHPLDQPSWGGSAAAAEDGSWRGGEGSTQMFTAPSFDGPADPGGFDDGARQDWSAGTRASWDREEPRGYDELGYDERGAASGGDGYPDRVHEDGDGYDDRLDDGVEYGEYGDGYDDRARDGLDGPPEEQETVAPGVPSDLGAVPPPVDRALRERAAEDELREEESDYEDGFTPADYGMPERPRQSRRRRDRIAADFPGFDDAPLGGDVGDAYPGYDSVDFLADTEPGANLTLWLGVASLLPGLGVITAVLALFVTGPKAKRTIRESRGTLDGLGLITTGTVFAVIGILVTVISVAIWFAL